MRVIGDPDNQPPDKWSSTTLLKHVCKPSRCSRRNFCPLFIWESRICFFPKVKQEIDVILLESLRNTSKSKNMVADSIVQVCIFMSLFPCSYARVFRRGLPNSNQQKVFHLCQIRMLVNFGCKVVGLSIFCPYGFIMARTCDT